MMFNLSLFRPVNLLMLLLGFEIMALNLLLPFPDSNDFYELSRLCLLMDDTIGYCVNSNWGFAHPLSCWLATKVTGDLLYAQRIINAIAMIVTCLVFYRVFLCKAAIGKEQVAALAVALLSPWCAELIVSVHMDIVPVMLVLCGIAFAVSTKRPHLIMLAGIFIGAAYWFRFHFLLFAVLFPVLVVIVNKHERCKRCILSMCGCGIALIIPHVLCYLMYGVPSISNEKFVLAQAVGSSDWSLDFAKKLDAITTADLLAQLDVKLFVMKYCYRFIKSGSSIFLLIFGLQLLKYLKNSTSSEINRDASFKLFVVAAYSIIAIMPFTLLRGFTYRLEAACIIFMLPIVIGGLAQKVSRTILFLFFAAVIIHTALYGKSFVRNRSSLMHINRVVTVRIPEKLLREQPERIVNCIDYYNPHNSYRLCNPMVFSGWGVRFAPFIEQCGYVNLEKPCESDIYKSAHTIILPAKTAYFSYSPEIISNNRILYSDSTLVIVSK